MSKFEIDGDVIMRVHEKYAFITFDNFGEIQTNGNKNSIEIRAKIKKAKHITPSVLFKIDDSISLVIDVDNIPEQLRGSHKFDKIGSIVIKEIGTYELTLDESQFEITNPVITLLINGNNIGECVVV